MSNRAPVLCPGCPLLLSYIGRNFLRTTALRNERFFRGEDVCEEALGPRFARNVLSGAKSRDAARYIAALEDSVPTSLMTQLRRLFNGNVTECRAALSSC